MAVFTSTTRRIRKGATLPATCSPGEVFGKTSGGSEGMYFCVTANTWTGPFDTSADSGDVVGPASSTDNALARFDSTTGKLLQNSLVTADDNGSVNIPSGQVYKVNNVDVLALKAPLASPTFTGTVVIPAPTYTAPTLLNSWVNLGGSNQVAGYTKHADGTVRLRGTISGGATTTIAFTLPVGYRPGATVGFPVTGNGSTLPTVTIDSSGNVTVFLATGGSYVQLDVISFLP